ncbi:TrkH family potassium uptake protein [Desulfonatronum parangueonense]
MSKQAAGLIYAVRFTVLGKYFGQLCLVVAVLTLLPLLVSLGYGETHISIRYAIVIGILAACGVVLGKMQAPRAVQVNEAMVLVALMFLFIPLLMTFPMMASGLSFSDALFETISASTTTGLTTVTDLESMTRTFLVSRAWMQWYGGLGILVFSLALLFRPGLATKQLAVTEAKDEGLVGGTKIHARHILIIYSTLTGVGLVWLLALGVRPFDAVLFIMASVSTAGFAPYDASLAALDSGIAQYSVILICVLAAIPLIFYRRLFLKNRQPTTDGLQLAWLLVLGGFASLLLGVFMIALQDAEWLDALYHAPLLAFSAQSTAGFASTDLSEFHAASKLVLIMAMAVGGGVGSTSGGLKILRLLMLLNLLRLLLRKLSATRHAVVTPSLAGKRVEDAEIQEALLIIGLFALVIIFSWLPFVVMGYDPMDSLFEVVSATGTVGLTVGVVDSGMPILLKGILCVDMLLGRLEILAWLVMVYPKTWIGRRLQG